MNALQRARLAGQLSAKVAELSAIPQQDNTGPANPLLLLERVRLSVEITKLLHELFGAAGNEAEAQASTYFKANMQGRTIKTQAGDVELLGSSFREMKRGMKKDVLKAKLIRFVVEILQTGLYSGRTPLNKDRTDTFIAFHFFKKVVEIDGLMVEAGVSVGERVDSKLAWGLGHEYTQAWAKRAGEKKPTSLLASGYEPEVGVGLDSVSAAPITNIAEVDEVVNIVILSVIDKNGDHIPELEDGHRVPLGLPGEQVLIDIAEGRRDGDGLDALYDLIHEAVMALEARDKLAGDAELTAQGAVTHWAELEEQTNG